MSETEIDTVTLERARAGDRDACRAVVVRYQRLVFHTAARVLGRSSPDLDDVAQDAMLKVLSALASFDPKGSARPSTWIATVTARTAVDALRVRRVVVSIDALRDARDERMGPDEALGDAQERHRLARALESLAPDQRAAMLLRVEHGLDHESIARALGVEVGTVKSRLARAREKLARALGEPGAEGARP